MTDRLSVPPTRLERRKPRASTAGDGLLPIPPPMARHLPRRFGDFLVTSELSRDALGRVFRAIDVSNNGEFVRLRIFDTRRVDAPMLLDAIEASAAMRPLIAGPFTARGERAGSVDRLPYLAWREVHGWTLDVLLAGLREAGWRLPVEHALLIADRIAGALDSAHRKTLEGKPIAHGLVWPGFVAIGADGDIRLAGFGLAAGISPTFEEPLLTRGVVPYVAPEERRRPRLSSQSDIYSVAAILLELLTERAPELEIREVALRNEDGFPPELVQLLRDSLAKAPERLPNMSAFRRELGRVLVTGRYSLSSFKLSQLLRDRLGPESIHYAEAGSPGLPPGLQIRDSRSAPPRAAALRDEDEVDAVLRDFWSRAETT